MSVPEPDATRLCSWAFAQRCRKLAPRQRQRSAQPGLNILARPNVFGSRKPVALRVESYAEWVRGSTSGLGIDHRLEAHVSARQSGKLWRLKRFYGPEQTATGQRRARTDNPTM